MFKLKQISLVLVSLLISFAGYADDLDVTLQNDVNSYVSQYAPSEGNTAIQLSVLLPNETTLRDYIAGKQMKESDTPATTNMMVQWGSITKEFTTLLIFQYLNQQHIDPQTFLNETLSEVLPEHFADSQTAWPDAWKKITIEQLMNMTSGIPDYLGFPGVDLYQITDLNSIVTPIAIFQTHRGCQQSMGCFPAGQGWNYSNTNYIILGMIVEKLYGTNFADVIQKNVLASMQRLGNNVVYTQSV